MTTAQLLPVADLFALQREIDPYDTYARWRAAGPLVKGGAGQWGVTRHAEVSALLTDPRVGSRMPKEYTDLVFGDGPTSSFRQDTILMKDGPGHRRLRRLLAQAFTPQLVRDLEGWVEALVAELVQPLLAGETCDLVDLLAFPLPTAVICQLLDLPMEDRDEVHRQSPALLGGDGPASDAAVVWFRAYMYRLLGRRRPDPDGGLLDRLLAAGDGDDGLTAEEVVDNAILLFFAGFETTRHLIASGGLALARRPDQWALLRNTAGLAPMAVEELLRFDGPVPSIPRLVLEPIELGGRTIAAGRVLYLLLGSANRDEAVFARADEVDLTRAPNPHVAFGGGGHRCLGMHLARLEGTVVLRSLSRALLTLAPAGEPTPRPAGTFRGWERVPVWGRPA
jgi:cytochrome P450